MAKYAAKMTRTADATLAVGALTSSATVRRAKVYDLVLGSPAAPADASFLWEAQRCTTAGTAGSGVTPQALDPGDGAALSVVGQAHSVNPTLTAGAIPLSIPLNQRATFRWVAAPGGELVIPATNVNGLAFLTPTSSAVAVVALMHFEEQ